MHFIQRLKWISQQPLPAKGVTNLHLNDDLPYHFQVFSYAQLPTLPTPRDLQYTFALIKTQSVGIARGRDRTKERGKEREKGREKKEKNQSLYLLLNQLRSVAGRSPLLSPLAGVETTWIRYHSYPIPKKATGLDSAWHSFGILKTNGRISGKQRNMNKPLECVC